MPLSKVIECRNRVFSALKKTLYCCLSLFGYLSQQTFTSLTGLEGIWTIAVLGCSYYIVHPQIKISWKCTYPQAIQDEDVFLHWNKCGIFLHYITCSPMDPLQWMDAIRMRAQTAEIIIHQLRYFEEKNCMFLISKSITTFLTSNQNKFFNHNIAFFSEKNHFVWIKREICTDQALFTSENKTDLNKCVGGFWCERTTADGLF